MRILTIIALCAGLASAQAFDKASPDKKAEEAFTNIQVLKGEPSTSLRGTMEYFNAALGVTCEACHDLTGFDKDKNPKKTARNMITMTKEINKSAFNGRLQVTCFTCHQGHEQPTAVAAIPAPPRVPQPPFQRFQQGQSPKTEEVIAKYQTALGGADKLAKIQSMIVKGTETLPDGKSATYELKVGGPDKVVAETKSPERSVTEVLNGKDAWGKAVGQGPAGVYHDSDELAPLLAHEAEVYPGSHALAGQPNLRFFGITKIGDRDVLVALPAQRTPTNDRFFFDKENGLLLRQSYVVPTQFGVLPTQIDYEDYRNVDGVMLPFRVKYSRPQASWTVNVSSVQTNASIPDSAFAK